MPNTLLTDSHEFICPVVQRGKKQCPVVQRQIPAQIPLQATSDHIREHPPGSKFGFQARKTCIAETCKKLK